MFEATPEKATPSLVLAGRLEAISLPDVLQVLAASRRDGVLRIEREDPPEIGEIELAAGRIIRASVTHAGQPLGELLVRRRSLEPRILGEALRRQSAAVPWKALGTVLLEMGVIEPGTLAEGLAEQISDTISQIMAWGRGVFRFRTGAEAVTSGDLPARLGVALDTQQLLLDAARRWDEGVLADH